MDFGAEPSEELAAQRRARYLAQVTAQGKRLRTGAEILASPRDSADHGIGASGRRPHLRLAGIEQAGRCLVLRRGRRSHGAGGQRSVPRSRW
jgi:hypothetical protein